MKNISSNVSELIGQMIMVGIINVVLVIKNMLKKLVVLKSVGD